MFVQTAAFFRGEICAPDSGRRRVRCVRWIRFARPGRRRRFAGRTFSEGDRYRRSVQRDERGNCRRTNRERGNAHAYEGSELTGR